MNLLLKANGGSDRKCNCFFSILECSNCKWVGGGGLQQKVMFRAG